MAVGIKITNGIGLTDSEIILDFRYRGKRLRDRLPRSPGELSGVSKRKGSKRRAEMEEEMNRSLLSDSGNAPRTIDDLIHYYYSQPEFTRRAPETQVRYRISIRTFAGWCASKGIRFIKHFTFESAKQFQTYLVEVQNKKPKGVNNDINTTGLLFKLELTRTGRQIDFDPFSGVKPIHVDWHPPRFHTDEERDLIIQYSERHENPDVLHWNMIFLYTGMRSKELNYLEQSRIAKDLTSISIEASETTGFRAKNKMFRSIPVHSQLRQHIQYFLERNKGKKFLIGGDAPYNKGRFLRSYRQVLAMIKKDHPHLDLSDTKIHTLRKDFGSIMKKNGTDIYTVSKLMGHSSVTVTEQIYVGVDNETMTSGIANIPQLYNKVETKAETHQDV